VGDEQEGTVLVAAVPSPRDRPWGCPRGAEGPRGAGSAAPSPGAAALRGPRCWDAEGGLSTASSCSEGWAVRYRH